MIKTIAKIRPTIDQYLKEHWANGLLFAGFLGVVLFSLGDSHWLKETRALQLAFVPAFILTYMLSISKIHFLVAFLFQQFFSMAAACQTAFNIIPLISRSSEDPFMTFLQIANVRSFAFGSRFQFIITNFPNKFRLLPEDFKLAILVWSIWLCVFLLNWMKNRRHNTLFGLMPFAVLLGLNIYFNNQQSQFLIAYLGIGLLFHALTSARSLFSSWRKKGIDYSEDLGLEWGTVTLVVVVLIISLTSGVVYLRDFDWEEYRRRRTAEVRSDSNAKDQEESIGLDTAPQITYTQDLVLNFSPPPSDDTIMFQARILDPENILGTSHRRVNYWRQQYYSRFDGQQWEEEGISTGQDQDLKNDSALMDLVMQRIEYFGSFNFGIALGIPVDIGNGYEIKVDSLGNSIIVRSDDEFVRSTIVYSRIPDPDISLLSIHPPDHSENFQEYLQLPESLSDRTIILTEKIIRGAENDYQKAIQIEQFLRLNYPYLLEVPHSPPGQDVVDYFLFDAPGGFCSYYASAMSVMLRVVGIPSRIVTGFQLGYFEPELGYYQVAASDAHAWVEAYFPGAGWVEFEPTAVFPISNTTFTEEERPSNSSPPVEIGNDLEKWLKFGGIFAGIMLLLLLLVVFGKQPKMGNWALGRVYSNYRYLLNRLTGEDEKNFTPLEFQINFFTIAVDMPKTKSALRVLTQMVNRDQYSREKATREDVRVVKKLIRRSYFEMVFQYFSKK